MEEDMTTSFPVTMGVPGMSAQNDLFPTILDCNDISGTTSPVYIQIDSVNSCTTSVERQTEESFVPVNTTSSRDPNVAFHCGDTNCPWPSCATHGAVLTNSKTYDDQRTHSLVSKMQSLSELYTSLLKTHSQTSIQLAETQIELQSAQTRIKQLKQTLKQKDSLCIELQSLKGTFVKTISEINIISNAIRERVVQLFPMENNDNFTNSECSLMTVYSKISKYVDPVLKNQFENLSKAINQMQLCLENEVNRRESSQKPKVEVYRTRPMFLENGEMDNSIDEEWCLRLEPVPDDNESMTINLENLNQLIDEPINDEFPTIIKPTSEDNTMNFSVINGDRISTIHNNNDEMPLAPSCTTVTNSISNNEPHIPNHELDQSKSSRRFVWCICGSKYKTKGSLRRHITRKAIPTCYNCGSCNKEYVTLSGLKRHMKESHKISLPPT